jgi:acetyl-CoA carboxylase carboxyl transferase subunit beta
MIRLRAGDDERERDSKQMATRDGLASPQARAAIDAVAVDFQEFEYPELDQLDNPPDWPGYSELMARARRLTGEAESVVCGVGAIGGADAVLVAFDFGFIGGSVGRLTGDRIVAAVATARRLRLPLVSLLASGGSRMQEGIVALHQLRRISAALAQARGDGIPHVSVLRDPTTGGVWATLGAGADVTIAVDGARVGFGGPRVRPPEEADHRAFTAAGQYESGNIDAVLPASHVAAALAGWLRLLRPRPADPPRPMPPPPGLGVSEPPTDGWSAVLAARSADRPRAWSYLRATLSDIQTISGDRCGGRDDAMLCGLGFADGRAVAFAAQAGTATTPAGYRTATRLIRLADRFGLPVLTLVDTPGAANGAVAESAGLGNAIAELFLAVAGAAVPVTTLVIGEGGSGGALALASHHDMWMTADAYFAVIAPELAASILKHDPADAPTIADGLRLRPQDLVDLGLARGIRVGQ